MPAGGPAAAQPVQPIGQMTPADIAALVDELIPAVAKFRASSSPLQVPLNAQTWSAQGGVQITQIASVGLGLRVRNWHHLAISITNAATAAQTFKPSCFFPFNLMANTQVQINGGANVYSASGIGGLLVSGRRHRGFFQPQTIGGLGPALSPAWCAINLGANLTATNADAAGIPLQLSGLKSVSVAGSSTGIMTVDFATEEWFVLDMESMLGALPLQNNSTYAILQRTLAAAFLSTSTTDQTFPLFNAGANLSVSAVAGTTQMLYDFASVPSDASLYTAIVSNSYQVQEQSGVTGTTGNGGVMYNIPQNQYLTTLHRLLFDANGNPIMFTSGVLGSQTAEVTNYTAAANGSNQRVIQYNGGAVVPIIQFPYRERMRQYESYGGDLLGQIGGYLLWDGTDTSNDVQAATDNMGWIDCYNVASPQSVENIGASVTGPTKATFVRESVVAGSVSVVGG